MARLTLINTTEYNNFENTTEVPNVVANETQQDTLASQVVDIVYLYYTPILVFLGIIGNLISVFVFFNSKLKFQSTSQYLSALAISDTIFLLQLVPPWLTATQDVTLFNEGGFCQFFVYISYVSSCLSAWLVVAFSVERVVAVQFPLLRTSMCTLARARYVILGLTLAAIILNIPVLRFAVPTPGECNIDRKYLNFAEKFNLVDTLISFTAPMGLIIFFNSCIVYSIYSFESNRLKVLNTEQNQISPRAPCVQLQVYPRAQQRITRMLLTVSSVYVLLNLPAYTIRIVAYMCRGNAVDITAKWNALQQGAALCFHTNFGINFFLYCLNGRNFRHALIQVIPYLRRRAERAEAARIAAAALAPANSISSFSPASLGSSSLEHATAVVIVQTPRSQPDVIKRWTFKNNRQGRGQPCPTATRPNIEPVDMELIENF